MKTYRPWTPGQAHLLPPSPTDWLPQGHLVYFILDVVKELDLGAITRAVDAKDARGEKPYSPVMMTALLLYAYCVGVFSSRRIERATHEDVAFRVLTGGDHPHFSRIADFRRRHVDAFAGIFVQTVHLCARAGLVKLGLVAIDGSKMQGNASKHKAMSYDRMCQDEERLQTEIKGLLTRAEATDQSEDARFGQGQRDEDLPAELRRREDRLIKIRAAKQELEREARQVRAARLLEQAVGQEEKASTESDPTERKRATTRAAKRRAQAEALGARGGDDDEPPSQLATPSSGLPSHAVKTTADGLPHGKAQYNFTDPQSRIQQRDGGFLQGYNCQAAVDAQAQVIVAQGVTNKQPDTHNLIPVLEQTAANSGRAPDAVAADSGYWLPSNVAFGESSGSDLYIAVPPPPSNTTAGAAGALPNESGGSAESPRSLMIKRPASQPGQELYARRKTIVEPVFGQIKEARGFRRFLLRCLRKVEAEWSMLTATHNLLKLFRYGRAAQTAC